MRTARIDGQDYELVAEFADGRGIIRKDGSFVMVDRVGGPGTWTLSDESARPGIEESYLKDLLRTIKKPPSGVK